MCFFPFQSGNPPKWPKCVQKWSKYNFFHPWWQKICNFGIKVSFLKFWSISWLKMKKRRPCSPSVSTRRNFYLLCDFFLFSQEILQNGRNASKNGQNTTFFTPGGQNMKLWNKSHFFEILKHFLTENEKTEAMLPKRIDKTQLLPFVWFFPFQSGNPPKWPKCVQKWSKYNFFHPWWPKYVTLE